VLKLLCIVICRFYAARRDKVLIRTLLAGGARKVSSNCIILAVKMGRRRWKQLASLIYVMNNAHRASMGLKRTPQDVYRVALSISLHLCGRAVTACTNQHDAIQLMQFFYARFARSASSNTVWGGSAFLRTHLVLYRSPKMCNVCVWNSVAIGGT